LFDAGFYYAYDYNEKLLGKPTHDLLLNACDLVDFVFVFPSSSSPGPKKDSIAFRDFFRYKYVMNVDGAAAAYRLPFLFAVRSLRYSIFISACSYPCLLFVHKGGSLVIWQESPYYEHIYHHFKPYVHYVPVKRDFSDLLEQLTWIKSHEDEVIKIAANGKKLARELLTPGITLSFLILVYCTVGSMLMIAVLFFIYRKCLLLHF